ncbi:MAG: hypothetical protein DYH13_06670 [Alphaproteobacteria bacterium PRO2]|nr:hypothetical protein [Alphaproteobacteria bacterium PRO2]
MRRKQYEGAVDPIEFYQTVCANTLTDATDPGFWPMAEARIKKASVQYRTGMAMAIVEQSHDLELQIKAAELVFKSTEVTSDTVDEAAKAIVQELKACPNGDQLVRAVQPALQQFFRRGGRTSRRATGPVITYECDIF